MELKFSKIDTKLHSSGELYSQFGVHPYVVLSGAPDFALGSYFWVPLSAGPASGTTLAASARTTTKQSTTKAKNSPNTIFSNHWKRVASFFQSL